MAGTFEYRLADGTRVPSVTTILSRFKNPRALMIWAHKQGLAGIDINKVRQEAADSGTLTHRMVEEYLAGRNPYAVLKDAPANIRRASELGFESFTTWADQTQLRVMATEVRLVSELHRYGGTMDANIITINGKRCVGDWKTSNALYPEMLMQIAAYAHLWNENHPDEPIDGGGVIVRFAKTEDGEVGQRDFEYRYFGDLDDPLEMFLTLRKAYELDKKLQQRMR